MDRRAWDFVSRMEGERDRRSQGLRLHASSRPSSRPLPARPAALARVQPLPAATLEDKVSPKRLFSLKTSAIVEPLAKTSRELGHSRPTTLPHHRGDEELRSAILPCRVRPPGIDSDGKLRLGSFPLPGAGPARNAISPITNLLFRVRAATGPAEGQRASVACLTKIFMRQEKYRRFVAPSNRECKTMLTMLT